jgi:regulation of enolase protein 1 (concanavalin A-like superfamily)
MCVTQTIRDWLTLFGVALATLLPAAAEPPPVPWLARDIGGPSAAGSTDVDGNNVWTLRGSGADIWSTSDQFHFCYQPLKGNGSISARFLGQDGGDAEWSRVGLMIRANDTAEAPNFHFAQAPAHGLVATARFQQYGNFRNFGEVGPSNRPERNLSLRLQRQGNDVSGFYSRDGLLWFQAAFVPQTLSSLPEEALFGLTATAHRDGEIATTRVDQVNVQPGTELVTGLIARASDRNVLLEWQSLPGAMGYQVYRGPSGAAAGQLVRLTNDRVTGTTYTDMGGALVNNTAYTYAVSAILPAPDGTLTERPPVGVRATPVAFPPGWSGSSVYELRPSRPPEIDAATGAFSLYSSGGGIGLGAADEFYFMSQPVDGDFVATVQLLNPPSNANGRAGLMIREEMKPTARNLMLGITGTRLLFSSRRIVDNGGTTQTEVTYGVSLQRPLRLRLIRRGSTITVQYSTDDGRTFRSAGPMVKFDPPLPSMLHVGLAGTATDRGQISEARFSQIQLERP